MTNLGCVLKSRDITLLTKVHTVKAMVFPVVMNGFPESSVGKESTCNAGDPNSIPGLARSPEEGIGYPLQYPWASLVAQTVKNPPAMRETWIWSLGWEDPPEKGKATHSTILAWRIPWTTVYGVTKSCTRLSNWTEWSYSLYESEWKALSHVWLFATPRTIQSMEFSRPEYWNR